MKPACLKRGDTIGVISPASQPDAALLECGVHFLEHLGFKVKLFPHVLNSTGFLAGEDEIRLEDLHSAWEDEEVKMIITSRGGYGCARLLESIQWERMKKKPKIFMGFSDITVLLNAIYKLTGLVTFHGPMVKTNFSAPSDRTVDYFLKAISGKRYTVVWEGEYFKAAGDIQGKIVGGCLSLVVSLLGTPYEPDFADKILFIEEVGEEDYRIDRMLFHLKYAGVFKKVKAVLLGYSDIGYDIYLDFFMKKAEVPLFTGFPAGHGSENITLPIGIPVILYKRRFRPELELLESPCSYSYIQ